MAKYSDPIITKTAILFDLHEPIYGSHFTIWDKWLKIAKEKNLNMVVKTPFGIATYKYATWMKGATLKKQYVNNPDVPMMMWGRDMLPDIKAREKRKEEEAKRNQDYTPEGAKKLLEAWKASKKGK